MTLSPLVSFLMPVYNAEATVLPALRSALEQRDVPGGLEAVVVDDGSTDSTRERLIKLAAADSRVNLIYSAHRGLVSALIQGQAACRGAFIARLDADDLAHPERIRAQLELLERDPGLGLAGAGVRYFPRRALRAGLLHYEKWLNGLLEVENSVDSDRESLAAGHNKIVRELFVECPLAHPTFLVRRKAFDQAGGYRDFAGLPEDYDLVFRLVESGWRLGGVGRVLHYWREHEKRASRNELRYSRESFRKLKLHHLLQLKLEGGRLPVSICGAGPVGKAWLKDLRAAGVEVRFLIEINPRRIGKKIHGVSVVTIQTLAAGADYPGLILGAVGQKGGRDSVRAQLDPLGYREGEDYICVA